MLSLIAYCSRNSATRTVGRRRRPFARSTTAAAARRTGLASTPTTVTASISGMVRTRRFQRDVVGLGGDHAGEVSPIGDAVAMSSSDPAATQRIVRLVGVYDADSTVRGELAYWVGARLGRRHCSLCEITHGSVRQRPEWKACQAGLPVPFDTFHRDDQPDAIRVAAGGQAPVVVAETDAGLRAAPQLARSRRVRWFYGSAGRGDRTSRHATRTGLDDGMIPAASARDGSTRTGV